MVIGGPMPDDFSARVRAVLAALPPGEVVTYGEVAAEAGFPRAARGVGAVLRASQGLPWWRVVRAGGYLVPHLADEQARRLEAEGVRVKAGRVRPPNSGHSRRPPRPRDPPPRLRPPRPRLTPRPPPTPPPNPPPPNPPPPNPPP